MNEVESKSLEKDSASTFHSKLLSLLTDEKYAGVYSMYGVINREMLSLSTPSILNRCRT